MSASDDQPAVDRPVVIAAEDPTSRDAQRCLQAYFDELDRRFDGGFDAGRSIPATVDDLVEPAGLLLLGPPPPGWRPTGASPRRSGSTGRPATSRSRRSTTSPTRTTGSRRT